MKRLRQRGAALLIAMLTVSLVATFAAAALWQQWRSIEVETAERARVQSGWILTGALDWSRLVLREDLRSSGNSRVDHLAEPWAVPLQEARLSSFLAADRNNTSTDSGGDILDAFLSGQIIDQQSLLNVQNLVVNNKVDSDTLMSFARLFELLGLPRSELDTMQENLRFALDTTASRSAEMAPLVPQKVEQLVWLGVPASTVAALQPFITIIPGQHDPININVNTAPAEVIYAVLHEISLAEAQKLVTRREQAPFRDLSEIPAVLGRDPSIVAAGQYRVGVASRFFEVRARLRLDKLVVEERSLIDRAEVNDITVIQRERGIVDPTALTQAAARR